MIIKIIGSMLVLACGFLFGIKEKMKFTQKTNILSGIINSIDFIHSEISCMCTPTEELLEKLCDTENAELKKFFNICKEQHIKRKDLPFSFIWNRALKEATYLNLNENEEETLSEIGNSFGRYSADEQLRIMLCARKNFEKHLRIAEEAKIRLGKLYSSLSLISGVAIVIILF